MGGGAPLAFLNKKTWHPSNMRNMEEVWKREQQAAAEAKKLAEIRKQLDEERKRQHLMQVAVDAGKVQKAERLDWMYAGSLAAKEDAAKRQEEQLLGQRPANLLEDKAEEKSRAEVAARLPSFYTDATPQTQNESWQRLNNDPLFAIRRQQQEALKNIRHNPVKMEQIIKEVQALKKGQDSKSGKKRKGKDKVKKFKKKHKHAQQDEEDSSPYSDQAAPKPGVGKHAGSHYDHNDDTSAFHRKAPGSRHSEPPELCQARDREKAEHRQHRARHGGEERRYRQDTDVSQRPRTGEPGEDHEPRRDRDWHKGEGEDRGHRDRQRSFRTPHIHDIDRHEQQDRHRLSEYQHEKDRGRPLREKEARQRQVREGGDTRDRQRDHSKNGEQDGDRQPGRDRRPGGADGEDLERSDSPARKTYRGAHDGTAMSLKPGYGLAINERAGTNNEEQEKRAAETRERLQEAAAKRKDEEHALKQAKGQRKEYKAGKMSEEEKARKLAEMMSNAEQHDEARMRRLHKSTRDADEPLSIKPLVPGAERQGAFLAAATRDVYTSIADHSSVEARISSRKHYNQR